MRNERNSQKRVFINNVDSYSSKYISKFLSGLVMRDNSDYGGEEEEKNNKEETDDDESLCFSNDAAETYHVAGTVSDQLGDNTWVKEQYYQLSREQLLDNLMKSDIIIYNITQHCQEVYDASWALRALHHNMAAFVKPKMYILISTVMTWANSNSDRHENEDLPFTDANFRTRRAHPNFTKHIHLEKKVLKLGKTNKIMFSTYVVASGLQYGMGEQIFHMFFKVSWQGAKVIPVFGEGKNIVPTIHINALAGVIHNLIVYPHHKYYLLAVDSANNTMEQILKAVASVLGPGRITQKPFEDIYLHQDLTMMEIDSLQVNLRMEAVELRDSFNSAQWSCSSGLVKNIEFVVEEYRQTRQFLEDVVQNAESDDDAALVDKKLINDLKEDMEQNGEINSGSKVVGEPGNYDLNTQEVEGEKFEKTEEKKREESQQRADEGQMEAGNNFQRASNWEQRTTSLRTVKQHEEEFLEAEYFQLKDYLIRHVMPTLAKGLIECAFIQPVDSVDFLAEYLIKNSPVTD